jgi:hypothetical protein
VTGRIESVHLGSTATADTFVPVARAGRQELLDAGDNTALAWSLDTETYPKAQFTIRFADDQEIDWEVGPRPPSQEAPGAGLVEQPTAPTEPAALHQDRNYGRRYIRSTRKVYRRCMRSTWLRPGEVTLNAPADV